MKQHFNVEKPREFRKRSPTFFLLIALGSLLVSQNACAGAVTAAIAPAEVPEVTFTQAPSDTPFRPGETLIFAISVRSHLMLASVHAEVRGAINYQFPATNPSDTAFTTVFRVVTAGATGDSLTLTVTATDILGNRGIGKRSVALR